MRRHGKRQSNPQLGGKRLGHRSLAVAAVVGVLVVAAAWWIGPGLFGSTSAVPEHRVVTATVVAPVPCTTAGAEETVSFEWQGTPRKGMLTACGHDRDEQVEVAVPVDAGSGPIDVDSVAGSTGYSALRGPIRLLLLALSCTAGGIYAFLVIRGPRMRMAPA